jgi:hypothetical protein
MKNLQRITGFHTGDPLRIQRRILNPQWGQSLGPVTLSVKQGDRELIVRPGQRFTPGPASSGGQSPLGLDPVVSFVYFDLPPEETSQFRSGEPFSYHILSEGSCLESGHLIAGDPVSPTNTALPGQSGYALTTSYTTYADACQTVTGRMAMIIDGFLDAILGNYRQLKVWDEHVRRRADNPLRLQLTYENINKFTPIEIFDGRNNPVSSSSLVGFDYRNGNFAIAGDDGHQDYFVTYTFNFFPESVLRMFIMQSVMELNFIGGGAGGGYLTHYKTLEETPETWDGLVVAGAAAKAWRRLATDLSLWRNWLIFDGDLGEGIQPPTGAVAQQQASEASQYYHTMFETYGASTKFDKFIAPPTIYHTIFATTGYGQFGPYVVGNQVTGGKFRGMVINRGWSY